MLVLTPSVRPLDLVLTILVGGPGANLGLRESSVKGDGLKTSGWLAPGNRADFIVVDFRRPHLTPALHPVSCFVHQGQAGDVASVMVDGRWLMRDGRVLTLHEPAIVAEAEHVARMAWRKLFAGRPDLKRPPGLDL